MYVFFIAIIASEWRFVNVSFSHFADDGNHRPVGIQEEPSAVPVDQTTILYADDAVRFKTSLHEMQYVILFFTGITVL